MPCLAVEIPDANKKPRESTGVFFEISNPPPASNFDGMVALHAKHVICLKNLTSIISDCKNGHYHSVLKVTLVPIRSLMAVPYRLFAVLKLRVL